VSQLSNSSKQTGSRCLVRSDLLQVGDVILTRGADLASTVIAKLTAGKFSHAALCIERAMILESDGATIRHKLLLHSGFVKINDALKNISRTPWEPKQSRSIQTYGNRDSEGSIDRRCSVSDGRGPRQELF
jgi:hypothetical protein